VEAAVKKARAAGMGKINIARELGIGVGTVRRMFG